MGTVPKVFISYARETLDHSDRVLALADRLETLGIEVIFDQYEPNPELPWPKWMERAVERADYILSVCTRQYYLRVTENQAPGTGLGAQWEGTLISNQLAKGGEQRKRFQVIQFDVEDRESIPSGLLGNNRFLIQRFELEDAQFEELYRVITNQPKATRPERGQLVQLPSRTRESIPRSGEDFEIPAESLIKEIQNLERVIPPPSKEVVKSKPFGKGTYLEKLARGHMEAARKCKRLEDFPSAIEYAQKAEKLDASNPEIQLILGDCHYKLKNFDKASMYFENYLRRNPNDLSVKFDIQVARFFTGKVQDLPDALSRVANETPIDESCVLYWASALADADLHDEAIAVIEDFDPDAANAMLTSNKAVYYWFIGRNDIAVDLLEKIPKSQLDAVTWTNLGVGRAESGRFGLAIEAIRMGIELGGHTAFADYALAEIYALMGDAEAAVATLSRVKASASVYFERARTERTFNRIRNSPEFEDLFR